MDLKVLKWQIHRGSLMRRLILKMLMFGTGLIVISFVQMEHDAQISEPWMLNNDSECPLNFGLNPSFNFTVLCKENEGLAKNVFQELMVNSFLDSDVKALCVGEGSDSAVLALTELGFSDVSGVNRHPFFSLLRRRFVYELNFEDNSFDFVFSRALDRVSVPALLVLEIERVLRSGGTGAMLLGPNSPTSGNLVRSATPVSSFLKSSDVVHVCGVGHYTLVLFKKRFEGMALFDQYKLPDHCPSVMNNKPFMPYLEKNPAKFETKISYLPNLMNISSRNKLVYINIGAGEFVDATITKMFNAHYPIPQHALDVYVIDHNPTALSLYVKTPGITFVYHPMLGGEEISQSSTNYTDDYLGDDRDFELVRWFHETVKEEGEFVVLMMNAGEAELQILDDLFRTGLVCRVDELFLRCSDTKPARCGDCKSLFKSLRNRGIFAHWLGE